MVEHVLVALVVVLYCALLVWILWTDRCDKKHRLPDEEVLRRLTESLGYRELRR